MKEKKNIKKIVIISAVCIAVIASGAYLFLRNRGIISSDKENTAEKPTENAETWEDYVSVSFYGLNGEGSVYIECSIPDFEEKVSEAQNNLADERAEILDGNDQKKFEEFQAYANEL